MEVVFLKQARFNNMPFDKNGIHGTGYDVMVGEFVNGSNPDGTQSIKCRWIDEYEGDWTEDIEPIWGYLDEEGNPLTQIEYVEIEKKDFEKKRRRKSL